METAVVSSVCKGYSTVEMQENEDKCFDREWDECFGQLSSFLQSPLRSDDLCDDDQESIYGWRDKKEVSNQIGQVQVCADRDVNFLETPAGLLEKNRSRKPRISTDQDSSEGIDDKLEYNNCKDGKDYDDCDFQTSDIEENILFIAEKQKLMERVYRVVHSDEEQYDATQAKIIVQNQYLGQQKRSSKSKEQHCIWKEAKAILTEICEKSGFVSMEKASALSIKNKKKRTALCMSTNPSDPCIDVSAVYSITSKQFGMLTKNDEFSDYFRDVGASSLKSLNDVSSLGQTSSAEQLNSLERTQRPIANNHLQNPDANNSISKLHTPFIEVRNPKRSDTHILPGTLESTLSSNTLQLDDATFAGSIPEYTDVTILDLQEALAMTSQARILTDATPPYHIVHANRAFMLQFLQSNMKARTSRTVVGLPIASVLTTSTMSLETMVSCIANATHPTKYVRGFFTVKSESTSCFEDLQRQCYIRATPIFDQTICRKIERKCGEKQQYSTPILSSLTFPSIEACMSHVLFQVSPENHQNMEVLNQLQPREYFPLASTITNRPDESNKNINTSKSMQMAALDKNLPIQVQVGMVG